MLHICNLTVLAASSGLFPLLDIPRWEGRISALFRTSLQITGPKQRLIHLQGGSLLVSPFSLRTPSILARIIADVPLVEGMSVSKEGPWIEIRGCLRLSLEETSYYRSPPMVTGRVDPKALRLAERTLRLEGRRGGLDAIPAGRAAARAIRKALTDGEPDRLLTATHAVVGLGPGLTPSGDDFLVGCVKGLWIFAAYDPKLYNTLDLLRRDLALLIHERTSRVGAEFIRHALDGQYAEVLDQAAAALFNPAEPEKVVSAISRLLAQGESSGTDTTQGLLASLDALLRANWKGKDTTRAL